MPNAGRGSETTHEIAIDGQIGRRRLGTLGAIEEQEASRLVDSARRIGICGTFDVENFGDLLFPIIARAELEKRLGPLTLEPFSYHAKSATSWPYAVHPLTDLPAAAAGLHVILVGGGDLIRFDKDVAPGYRPPTPDMHHPTGYWLAPMLVGAQAGAPVLWNALGVRGPVPSWAESLLKLAVESSDYPNVRDEASRRILDPFRGEVDIEVVPDTAFGVGQLLDVAEPSPEYLRIRESAGLTDGYLLIQATDTLGSFWRLIDDDPRGLGDVQAVTVAIGPALGDDIATFGRRPGVTAVRPWPHPLVLAELIAHAAGVVGTSLHLAITALALGVPVFRPSQAMTGKYEVLQGFEGIGTFDRTVDVDPEWLRVRLGKTQPSAAVRDSLGRLSRHWDRIASLASAPSSRRTGVASVSRFLLSAPSLLESLAADLLSARLERDAATAERNRVTEERDIVTAERNRVTAERDEAAAQRDAVTAERDTVAAARDALDAQLAAIQGSRSWRLTAPLRALRDRLRRSANKRREGDT
ncbi:MAG: polysaccharide pyruvyl transferase family protein [Acidimicrobiia bacterium]|nr:polysaccharide pyruvyl transferase family protein [Acidimicrobiia bacterium]